MRTATTTLAILAVALAVLASSTPSHALGLSASSMDDTLAALGSDDYTARVEATKALANAGADAIDIVKTVAEHEDPEVAWRVRMILVDIGITGDDATHQKVLTTLDELAKGGQASFQGLAPQVTRWRQIRSMPMQQQIHQLNAFIHNGSVVDPIFFGRLRGC